VSQATDIKFSAGHPICSFGPHGYKFEYSTQLPKEYSSIGLARPIRMKYLRYASMALFAFGVSSSNELQLVSVHQILAVANFQKSSLATSGYSGSILVWESDTSCGKDGSPPDGSGTYNNLSNICLSMNGPMSSIEVEPDSYTELYFIQFFSDTECDNEVWSVSNTGVQCYSPPSGYPSLMSMYITIYS